MLGLLLPGTGRVRNQACLLFPPLRPASICPLFFAKCLPACPSLGRGLMTTPSAERRRRRSLFALTTTTARVQCAHAVQPVQPVKGALVGSSPGHWWTWATRTHPGCRRHSLVHRSFSVRELQFCGRKGGMGTAAVGAPRGLHCNTQHSTAYVRTWVYGMEPATMHTNFGAGVGPTPQPETATREKGCCMELLQHPRFPKASCLPGCSPPLAANLHVRRRTCWVVWMLW